MTNSRPKRHHWWPQLQSGHWAAADGLINAVRADGSFFRAKPINIGVEGELYTRFELTGAKNLTIEKWFSNEIESPFVSALQHLVAANIFRSRPLPQRDIVKEGELRDLGFIVPKVVETLPLSTADRDAIDAYLAALLVRNPRYLSKLVQFHDDNGTPLSRELTRGEAIKTVALDNMLSVFEIYRDQIARSHLGLIIAECSNEFIFSDAGITAQEPWRPGPIPFDIHAPLTPKLALEVFPVPSTAPRECYIMGEQQGRLSLQSDSTR